jgi:hypothetical protein
VPAARTHSRQLPCPEIHKENLLRRQGVVARRSDVRMRAASLGAGPISLRSQSACGSRPQVTIHVPAAPALGLPPPGIMIDGLSPTCNGRQMVYLCTFGPASMPLPHDAILPEPQELTGSLNEAPTHQCNACLCEPLPASFGAALIRATREARVPGHGPSVWPVSRQDLLPQHRSARSGKMESRDARSCRCQLIERPVGVALLVSECGQSVRGYRKDPRRAFQT